MGRPARDFLKQVLPRFKEKNSIEFVIANGENAAGGSSITPDTAKEIISAGVDVITSGDHIYKKKAAQEALEDLPLIRPLNYGDLAAGSGYTIKKAGQEKIAVINLLGRVFMQPADCPFKAVRDILPKLKKEATIIIVDMHAEATSEKLAMGYYLGGKVSAVLGTHTHVPTADQRIIDRFTAYVTDVGMTGSFDSILGREKEQIISRYITNMPVRFDLAQEGLTMQGVVFDIDKKQGRALNIKRIECKKGESYER